MNSLIEKSTKERRDKVVKEMNQPQAEEKPRDRWFMNQPGGATSVPSDQVTFNTQVVSPQGAVVPQQTQQAVPPTAIPNQPTTQQQATPVDEDQLVKELEARKQESPIKSYYGHLRTILPMVEQKRMAAAKAREEQQKPKTAPVAKRPPTPGRSPEEQATLRQLAVNNDLNVATIAREAKRAETPPDEVVVSLH